MSLPTPLLRKDVVKDLLRKHWLFAIDCDHATQTDRAKCACGWSSPAMPSIGAAIDLWIDHVLLGE